MRSRFRPKGISVKVPNLKMERVTLREAEQRKTQKVSNAALVFCALTNDFHMSIPSVRAGPEPVRPTELKRGSPQLKEKISYQISSTYFIIKCLLASYRTNGLFFGKSVRYCKLFKL